MHTNLVVALNALKFAWRVDEEQALDLGATIIGIQV